MALAMVLTRVAVTAVRAARLADDIPWNQHQAATGLRRRHTHLHSHAH